MTHPLSLSVGAGFFFDKKADFPFLRLRRRHRLADGVKDDLELSVDDLRILIDNASREIKPAKPILPGDIADLSPLRQAQREIAAAK